MVCASPLNQYTEQTRLSLLSVNAFRFSLGKNGQNVKFAVLKATAGFETALHCTFVNTFQALQAGYQPKNMICSANWALKVQLAWEEEINAAQEKEYLKDHAQSKISYV